MSSIAQCVLVLTKQVEHSRRAEAARRRQRSALVRRIAEVLTEFQITPGELAAARRAVREKQALGGAVPAASDRSE